ncbi:MAG: type I-U CRISPR-associated protein Csb2 [Rubripirellula sp.]
MFGIEIKFPAGRYHATLWQTHVNEGQVEWPPSPWRLLRAWMSVGYTHLAWRDEVPSEFSELIDMIAKSPPSYRLPRGVTSHTRHYMPVIEGKSQKTSKVVDSFIRILGDESLWMKFDATLSDSQTKLLGELCDNLAYLGRAESWVDVSLHNETPTDGVWMTSQPQAAPQLDCVTTRVLSPIASAAYESWRKETEDSTIERERQKNGGKLTKAQKKKIEAKFPASMTDCLAMDTAWLLDTGWSQPPGTQWIDYQTPVEPDRVPARKSKTRISVRRQPPQLALLALTSDTVSGKTLPAVSRTIAVAEAIHEAAVRENSKLLGEPSPVFTGKFGKETRQHQHMHFFPIDLDEDGRLDHVLAFCPLRIDHSTKQTLSRLRFIYSKKLPRTYVTWVGAGDLDQMLANVRYRSGKSLGMLGESKVFQTRTPYVPSRHLKKRYPIEANIRDECRFRGLPEPKLVELSERNCGKFWLTRKDEDKRPPRSEGFHLTLSFDRPVVGPLSLGYGSHFGLGLFDAVSATT